MPATRLDLQVMRVTTVALLPIIRLMVLPILWREIFPEGRVPRGSISLRFVMMTYHAIGTDHLADHATCGTSIGMLRIMGSPLMSFKRVPCNLQLHRHRLI